MITSCLSLFMAVSSHLGLAGDYNSFHPHARCLINDTITGVFYNSEKNVSLYAGKKYNNIEYGFATGYSGAEIVPFIRYTDKGWFIAPAYEYDNDNIGLTIGYEWKFK